MVKLVLHFNHKIIFPLIYLALITFAGCTPQPGAIQVIQKSEFPTYRGDEVRDQIELDVLIQISDDGHVTDARLLNTSGDQEWDIAALDSLKQWTFTKPPAERSTFTIKRKIIVNLELVGRDDPESPIRRVERIIGVIETTNKTNAEAFHKQLKADSEFLELMRHIQQHEPEDAVARIYYDFSENDYPEHILQIVQNLDHGAFTRPLSLDDGYVIFKRFDDNTRLPPHLHQ